MKKHNADWHYAIKQLKAEIKTLKRYKLPTFQIEVKLFTKLLMN